ncbi:hypothetical protein BDR03DRAFT_979650 [Suillus americanus]|nr:hypothetical protein BDR03DRAFT_979650 [Suillus americanus]
MCKEIQICEDIQICMIYIFASLESQASSFEFSTQCQEFGAQVSVLDTRYSVKARNGVGLLLRKDSSEKDEGNYRLDFGLRVQKVLKRLKGTRWSMPVVVENENNAIKHAPMDFGGRGQDMRRTGNGSFEGALEGDERRRKAPKYDEMRQSMMKGA